MTEPSEAEVTAAMQPILQAFTFSEVIARSVARAALTAAAQAKEKAPIMNVSEAEVEAAITAYNEVTSHARDNRIFVTSEDRIVAIRAALTAAAQVREREGQQNMIMGTLGTIANMPDEDNEWDGTDKFRDAREMARTVMAHTPIQATTDPDLLPIYGATEPAEASRDQPETKS